MQDIKAVVWHPEGEILVSCSYDDTIKLWRESDDEWVCEQILTGAALIIAAFCYDITAQSLCLSLRQDVKYTSRD